MYISEFRDVSSKLTVIEGTIVVNKESHKAMIIGKDGLKIKEVGTLSRLKLEEVSDGAVCVGVGVIMRVVCSFWIVVFT